MYISKAMSHVCEKKKRNTFCVLAWAMAITHWPMLGNASRHPFNLARSLLCANNFF